MGRGKPGRNDGRRSDPWGFGLEKLSNGRNPCLECGTETTGRHHVVPKSLGGNRQVPLCVECHSKAHGERTIHSNLIKEGIERARNSGKQIGAPTVVNADVKIRMKMSRDDGMTIRDIAAKYNVSVGTVHKYCGVHDQ